MGMKKEAVWLSHLSSPEQAHLEAAISQQAQPTWIKQRRDVK